MKQQITPNLWFDHNAQESVDFYIAAFHGSKIKTKSYYPNSAEEGLAVDHDGSIRRAAPVHRHFIVVYG